MNSERKNFGIIKVSTGVVAKRDQNKQYADTVDAEHIGHIVDQIAEVREELGRVCVVTSGAIAIGRGAYSHIANPHNDKETVPMKRKYSIIGQPMLHAAYAEHLARNELFAGQHLLTSIDYARREYREFLQDMLQNDPLLIPIMNENDALSPEEIEGNFTDNDHMASDVAIEFGANRMIVLTRTNGILRNVNESTSAMKVIQPGDDEWRKYVNGDVADNGRGGMIRKCEYMEAAAAAGVECIVVDGRQRDVIIDAVRQPLENRPGTTFLPNRKAV